IISLSENSRSAWVFESREESITWIPTVEHMLEDGLLMTYLHVLKDAEIIQLTQNYFQNKKPDWIELNKDIKQKHLLELHQKCKSIHFPLKIILTIFHRSSLLNHLSVLKDYDVDIEVAVTVYHRVLSWWDNKI